jgi:hypothetical protein
MLARLAQELNGMAETVPLVAWLFTSSRGIVKRGTDLAVETVSQERLIFPRIGRLVGGLFVAHSSKYSAKA